MAEPMILELLSNLKTRVATNETNIAKNASTITANKTILDNHMADDVRHWTTSDRQNFDRVVHFKGYFTTEAKLKEAYATGALGDYAIVGATDTVWLWDDTTSKWLNSTEQGIVISVNGRTGEVVLTKTDVGLSNVDNTSDKNKPVSTAQQTALNAKADRKKITESEIDGFTLRAGIYDLNGVSRTILGFTSSYWSVIVGENSGSSNKPATQIWTNYGTSEVSHVYVRHQISNTSWSEFKELATTVQIDNLQTQITTNKTNIASNKTNIESLQNDRAERKLITLDEADGMELRSGLYYIREQKTILDCTSGGWTLIVNEQDNGTLYNATQIWMNATGSSINRIFYRQFKDLSTKEWYDFVELRTSHQITDADIITFRHYKGYYATADALTTAQKTGSAGDYAVVGENQVMFIWNTTENAWTSIINEQSIGSGAVTSVNGMVGAVTLTKSNVGLTNVDNTADANKNVNSAKTLTTTRKIDGVNFNGSADITHYGTCSTAAATAAKTVACTGFNLVTGAWIAVRFTVTNTAAVADLTLNVNGTGAKGIKYRNANLPAVGDLAANRTYLFVYDGTNYQWIGDRNTDANNYVTQTNTTGNANYRVLFGNTADDTTRTEAARKSSKFYGNPSTGEFGATSFKINGGASIKYDVTNSKIQFLIGTTVVATLDANGVFNANELTENTGTTIT